MKAIPLRAIPAESISAVFLHDLRHSIFAIHLTPLLLETHRDDPQRFHEICRGLTHECENLSALIEGKLGKADEARKALSGDLRVLRGEVGKG